MNFFLTGKKICNIKCKDAFIYNEYDHVFNDTSNLKEHIRTYTREKQICQIYQSFKWRGIMPDIILN